MPRVAAQDTADALAAAADRAVLAHRLDHVLAAARLEPAHRRQQRPQHGPIGHHDQDHEAVEQPARSGPEIAQYGHGDALSPAASGFASEAAASFKIFLCACLTSFTS